MSISKNKGSIDAVAFHEKRNLYYIYEFDPKTDKLKWLRLDTFIVGKLNNSPLKFAAKRDLKVLDKKKGSKIIDLFLKIDKLT